MRRMICIFNYTPFTSLDGNNSVEFYLAQALTKKGHDITFICSNKTVADACKKKFPKAVIHHLNLDLGRFSKSKYINYFRFSIRARKYVEPDSIAFGQHLSSAMAASISKAMIKAGAIDDFWSEYYLTSNKNLYGRFMHFLISLAEIFVIRRLDLLFTTTPTQQKILLKKGAKNCTVVGVAANLDKFYPKKKEVKLLKKMNLTSETVICYQGAIKKHDGLDYLILDKTQIEKMNLRFLIIGDGPYLPVFKKKIKKKGLSEYFRYTGWVNQEEVPGFMSLADINAIPLVKNRATRGVLPYKLFEAMAMGIPSIITDLPGIRTSLAQDQVVLFDPDKKNSLLQAIISLKNKTKYSQIRKNNLDIIKKYSWDKYGDRLAELILTSVSGKKHNQ